MQDIGKDKLDNPRSYKDDSATPIAPETDDEGYEKPTEDEQLDYDLLTIRAQKIMFGDGKDKILTLLGASDIPAKGMGKAASMIIKSLMDSAKQSGREIDGNTAINAAAEIVEDLSALAKSAGVYEYNSPEEEKKQMEDAMIWGVKYYGDGMIARGEITPEMQQIAQKQVDEGLAAEAATAPKPKEDKVASAVKEGIASGGIVNNKMKGGV